MPFEGFGHYYMHFKSTSLHCIGSFILVCCRFLPDHSDSDSAVSPPVTCIGSVTFNLCSQCSGGCSDVQETAEGQS